MPLVLQGDSRDALAAVRARVEEIEAAGGEGLAEGLFALARLLEREPGVRRALTDPAAPAAGKESLAQSLFAQRVDDAALRVLAAASAQRWSRPRDLVDSLDVLGVSVLLGVAERAGALDEVEDELFRFGRVVESQPALRAALTDAGLPADRKRSVLDALLAERASGLAQRIVREAVEAPHGRSVEEALQDAVDAAAARRGRLLAEVRVAVELSPAQLDRLAAGLERLLGRPVQVQVVVDPTVIGGVSVRVGENLVDGSVAAKLDQARRLLAG